MCVDPIMLFLMPEMPDTKQEEKKPEKPKEEEKPKEKSHYDIELSKFD